MIRVLKGVFIFVLVMLLLFSPSAYAQSNFKEGRSVTIEKTEIVNENLFITADNVRILGTVNSDVYAAGGNIYIEGIVNGDILAAGGNLDISGKINGNVRVAGGQIRISGEVTRNITTLGGQIILENNAKLGGSLTGAGGNLEVRSPVKNGIQIAGGNLLVDNVVGGNITFAGGNLTFGDNSDVSGDVNYYSENEAAISDGAKITGKVSQNVPPQEYKEARVAAANAGPAIFKFWFFVSFLSSLLIGLIIIKLVPNLSIKIAEGLKTNFLKNLGLGFIFLIVVPFAALALLFTVVGIPLAIFVMMLFGFTLYLSKIFAAIFIGRIVTTKVTRTKSNYLDFAIGLLLYSLLFFIPVIGWVMQFGLNLASIGSLLVVKKETYSTLLEKKLV